MKRWIFLHCTAFFLTALFSQNGFAAWKIVQKQTSPKTQTSPATENTIVTLIDDDRMRVETTRVKPPDKNGTGPGIMIFDGSQAFGCSRPEKSGKGKCMKFLLSDSLNAMSDLTKSVGGGNGAIRIKEFKLDDTGKTKKLASLNCKVFRQRMTSEISILSQQNSAESNSEGCWTSEISMKKIAIAMEREIKDAKKNIVMNPAVAKEMEKLRNAGFELEKHDVMLIKMPMLANSNMTMESNTALVSAQKTAVAASQFKIPSGYTVVDPPKPGAWKPPPPKKNTPKPKLKKKK